MIAQQGVAGLILAAGGGRRFGSPKAPYRFDGERLVDRAVKTLIAGGCDPIVVVLGAWVGSVPDAQIVVNEDWEVGLSTSLTCGIQWMHEQAGIESALIVLVDTPSMTQESVDRVRRAAGSLVVSRYGDRWGHPVRISRNHWEALANFVSGDEGARRYLQRHVEELTMLDADESEMPTDIDYRLPPAQSDGQ
ncbi:MAG: nucleotidyltransferase family protein [Actinobacteria bacterium]|nr:nucleotidyltransferase family protein [Actinomycetota bacterium]